jgi:hypothetical protein
MRPGIECLVEFVHRNPGAAVGNVFPASRTHEEVVAAVAGAVRTSHGKQGVECVGFTHRRSFVLDVRNVLETLGGGLASQMNPAAIQFPTPDMPFLCGGLLAASPFVRCSVI